MSKELKKRLISIIKPVMFLMAFSFCLVIASASQALAASAIAVVSTDPVDGAEGVPVNQFITVTTDTLSTFDWTQITLLDEEGAGVGYSYFAGVDNDMNIVPDKMLNYNKKYTLYIPAGAITDANDPAVAMPNDTEVQVTFQTAFRLSDLLKNLTTFNTLIQTNSPRKINVVVPKKYMTKFVISYTSISEITPAITNVDINAETDVKRITVKFGSSATQEAVKSSTVWNSGYVGTLTTTGQDDSGNETTVGKDIVFTAYDGYGRVVEKNTIKLDPKGQTVDLTKAKSLVVSKTFADLVVNNGKLFTDIYKYYSASDLTLSVTD